MARRDGDSDELLKIIKRIEQYSTAIAEMTTKVYQNWSALPDEVKNFFISALSSHAATAPFAASIALAVCTVVICHIHISRIHAKCVALNVKHVSLREDLAGVSSSLRSIINKIQTSGHTISGAECEILLRELEIDLNLLESAYRTVQSEANRHYYWSFMTAFLQVTTPMLIVGLTFLWCLKYGNFQLDSYGFAFLGVLLAMFSGALAVFFFSIRKLEDIASLRNDISDNYSKIMDIRVQIHAEHEIVAARVKAGLMPQNKTIN